MTISIGILLLIRASGIRPVLGGANGEEIKETVRGITLYLVFRPSTIA